MALARQRHVVRREVPSKAPDEVVERERSRKAELKGQQGQLRERLAELEQ